MTNNAMLFLFMKIVMSNKVLCRGGDLEHQSGRFNVSSNKHRQERRTDSKPPKDPL